MTAPNLARAAVEGMLCNLADGLDLLVAQLAGVGTTVRRVILTGRGARLDAVRLMAPAIFGVPVAIAVGGSVSDDGQGSSALSPAQAKLLGGSEIMAIGAARQAAWVLAATSAPSGEVSVPPAWPEAVVFKDSPVAKPGIGDGVRAQYSGARDAANLPAMQVHPTMPTMPAAAVSAMVSASGPVTDGSSQASASPAPPVPSSSSPSLSPGALASAKTVSAAPAASKGPAVPVNPGGPGTSGAPMSTGSREKPNSRQTPPTTGFPPITSASAAFDDDYHGRRRR